MFDLRTEPWLPVLDRTGSSRLIGLNEALRDAHELRGLATSTPLERVAITRMLVAIAHRALNGPRTLEEARDHYRVGRVPREVIGYVERTDGVWDLFDPARPWLQTPSAAIDAVGESPLSRLFPWQPTGNNPTLWEHTYDDAPEGHDPGHAARGLLVAHTFALGGGVSKPFNFRDGMIAGKLVCLIEGNTLAETIMLNAVGYADDEPIPKSSQDMPAWEREERPPKRDGTIVDGYVDFLTLCTRRVLLQADDDGLVRHCQYVQGLSPIDVGARDPFVPYKRGKDGFVPVRPNPRRALWRDLPAITAGLADPELRASTGVLRWATQLTEGLPSRLRVVGIIRNQAKVEDVIDGELRIPTAIVDSPDHRHELQTTLELADDAEKALFEAVRAAAKNLIADNEAAALARRLLGATSFWASLEQPFSALVSDLSPLSVDEISDTDASSTPLRAWEDSIVSEARATYEQAVGTLGDAGRNLAAAARGRDRLEGWLWKNILSHRMTDRKAA